MKRTTIFLPEEMHERLRREAFQTRLSMAELIRSKLEQQPRKTRTGQKKDPLSKVIGIVQDGTLTRNIDEEIYDL